MCKLFILSLLFISLCTQVFAAKNYAILHADYPNYVQDVQTKLFPFVGNVSAISVQYANPTAQQLATFDAVLVYSNYALYDNVGLGNLLADYVDSGKGVIIAVFSLTTFFSNSYPAGRFQGTGNNTYYVITPGPRLYNPDLTLTVVDSSHPILAGVKTFDGGDDSFRGSGGWATSDVHSVATWSDKTTPLVGTRVIKNAKRADLNIFPPSADAYPGFWVVTSDGARLIANTFDWVAGGSPQSCSTYTDCAMCATNNCQWCLDTKLCSDATLTCPDRVVKPGNCPSPACAGFSKCSSCLGTGNACSWCLDNSTCVTKNFACAGEINQPSFCSTKIF